MVFGCSTVRRVVKRVKKLIKNKKDKKQKRKRNFSVKRITVAPETIGYCAPRPNLLPLGDKLSLLLKQRIPERCRQMTNAGKGACEKLTYGSYMSGNAGSIPASVRAEPICDWVDQTCDVVAGVAVKGGKGGTFKRKT